MTLNLRTLYTGDTDYISKHNLNYSDIQSQFNPVQADVEALKAAGAPGADLDYRQNAFNMLINNALDHWQRGTDERPDAWRVRNQVPAFAVERSTETQLNTYSAKTTNQGQLTQDVAEEVRLAIEASSFFSFGAYVKTDTANQARIGIYDGVTTQWSDYHVGDGSWQLRTKNVSFVTQPSALRFVLDSSGGEVYWNSLVAIRGNPASGPAYVPNDPALEYLRVLSLYEIGSTNVRGVGRLDGQHLAEEVPYEASATASGASFVIPVAVPNNSAIIGVIIRVDNTLTGSGVSSWSAALSGGAIDTIATGQALTAGTVAAIPFVGVEVSGITNITISPDAGTFIDGRMSAVAVVRRMNAAYDFTTRDRELEQRITFASPKRATPLVTIVDDDTGYEFVAYNVDKHGFNLLVSEIGAESRLRGFEYVDIDWIAEVVGT